MATTLLQKNKANTTVNQNHADVTMSSTTAGTLLVVCGGNAAGLTVSSVTDGGDTFTQVTGAAAVDVTDSFGTDIWYCLSGAGGKTAFSVVFSGSSGANKELWVFEVSYGGSASTDGGNALSNGIGVASVDTGAAITTTGTDGFLAGCIVTLGGITGMNAGNEFTIGDITATSDASAYLISSTAASHTPVWADSSPTSRFSSSSAAFKFTGGGGATTWGPQLSDRHNRIVQND